MGGAQGSEKSDRRAVGCIYVGCLYVCAPRLSLGVLQPLSVGNALIALPDLRQSQAIGLHESRAALKIVLGGAQ